MERNHKDCQNDIVRGMMTFGTRGTACFRERRGRRADLYQALHYDRLASANFPLSLPPAFKTLQPWPRFATLTPRDHLKSISA